MFFQRKIRDMSGPDFLLPFFIFLLDHLGFQRVLILPVCSLIVYILYLFYEYRTLFLEHLKLVISFALNSIYFTQLFLFSYGSLDIRRSLMHYLYFSKYLTYFVSFPVPKTYLQKQDLCIENLYCYYTEFGNFFLQHVLCETVDFFKIVFH